MCHRTACCRHLVKSLLLLACFKLIRLFAVLDAGDVVFSAKDFERPRVVFVKPGDRLVRISEWPVGLGEKRGRRHRSLLPRILDLDFVAPDRAGSFHVPWLLNVTLMAIPLGGIVQGTVDGSSVIEAAEFDRVLAEASTSTSPYGHTDKVSASLQSLFAGVCIDDERFQTGLMSMLRGVLSSIAIDTKRLAWIAANTLTYSRISGDEFVMEGNLGGVVMLRLCVWTDFATPLGLRWRFRPHEHGYDAFISVQVAGSLEQHLFDRSGLLLDSLEFTPMLYRQGHSFDGKFWEDQMPLQQSPFRGRVLHMQQGSWYFFPPRWIHAVRNPSGPATVTLELHLLSNQSSCGDVQPALVRTPVQEASPALKEWFKKHKEQMRKRVLAYLMGGAQGALDLEVFGSRG